jgi:hypothetical protein
MACTRSHIRRHQRHTSLISITAGECAIEPRIKPVPKPCIYLPKSAHDTKYIHTYIIMVNVCVAQSMSYSYLMRRVLLLTIER